MNSPCGHRAATQLSLNKTHPLCSCGFPNRSPTGPRVAHLWRPASRPYLRDGCPHTKAPFPGSSLQTSVAKRLPRTPAARSTGTREGGGVNWPESGALIARAAGRTDLMTPPHPLRKQFSQNPRGVNKGNSQQVARQVLPKRAPRSLTRNKNANIPANHGPNPRRNRGTLRPRHTGGRDQSRAAWGAAT